MRNFALTIVCLGLCSGSALLAQSPHAPAVPLALERRTNADIIQMIAAGLSEQVIVGSIRQAGGTDFNLTPAGLIALKKAGVSDALILVMQAGKTPGGPSLLSN